MFSILNIKSDDDSRRWNLYRWIGAVMSNKFVLLAILVVQTSASVVMIRWSKLHYPKYRQTTAVFFLESTKFISCIIILIIQNRGLQGFWREMQPQLSFYSWMLLLPPAFIYAFQNNLLHVALENLDAALYTVIYELKVLWTAIFSMLMLRRKLTWQQGLCLICLFLGVVLIEFSKKEEGQEIKVETETKPKAEWWKESQGFIAVLLASITSGFAGVYFEKVVKTGKVSIFIRNLQLGFFGIISTSMMVQVKDGWSVILEEGLFNNYVFFIWSIILVQALGGLVVGLVVEKLDNIIKGFANGISVVLGCVLSMFLFDFRPSLNFLFGATLVVGSAFIFKKYPYINPNASNNPTTKPGVPPVMTNGTGHDLPVIPMTSVVVDPSDLRARYVSPHPLNSSSSPPSPTRSNEGSRHVYQPVPSTPSNPATVLYL